MSQQVVLIAFQIVVLILAFSVHECAHAWTAWRLGDPTARMLGRVTLNPTQALRPARFGAVSAYFSGLRWVSRRVGQAYARHRTELQELQARRHSCDSCGACQQPALGYDCIDFVVDYEAPHSGRSHLDRHGDGAGPHVPGIVTEGLPTLFPIALFLYFVILINLLLFVFNLIPIPPLDGSHILRHFLPYKAVQLYDRMGMFGLIILFLVGGRFIGAASSSPIFATFNHILFALLIFGFVRKKVERGGCGDFCEIWAFLRGVLGKVGGWTWFFRGENVVECVVNVVA